MKGAQRFEMNLLPVCSMAAVGVIPLFLFRLRSLKMRSPYFIILFDAGVMVCVFDFGVIPQTRIADVIFSGSEPQFVGSLGARSVTSGVFPF